MTTIISSTEAKTRLGNLLGEAQRQPVRIENKGTTVAAVMFEYEADEVSRLAVLQQALKAGITQAEQGQLISSEEAFAGLL